jgi:hypothetical protein
MDLNTLKEYLKIHIISLEQDLENISDEMEKLDPACKDFNELDFEYNHMSGQIIATRYILSVEYNYDNHTLITTTTETR